MTTPPLQGDREFKASIKDCDLRAHPGCTGKFFLVKPGQTACQLCLPFPSQNKKLFLPKPVNVEPEWVTPSRAEYITGKPFISITRWAKAGKVRSRILPKTRGTGLEVHLDSLWQYINKRTLQIMRNKAKLKK